VLAESTTTFGELLRRHRVAAGLTQEALAARAGLSVYGIQKLERGTTRPYRDTAARLALALELTPDEAARFQAAVEPVRRRGSPPRESEGVTAPQQAPGDTRHNLPAALTSFVGREQELSSIPPRLRAARLLTLSGVGGSGKTRLAVELARRLVQEYRDGVWLVELAQVTDPTLVPHRLAAVLDVEESADRPLEQALAVAHRNSQLLLVLDNCEHLLDACAALVDLLLRECPSLQVLATSREPIGIPGEVTWAVFPLATPDPQVDGSVDKIERSPAVRLFVDRASAAQPSFVLDSNNAEPVAQICRRLDGIPLALELAAARLDALTPDQLASRLDQRFALLTGGNRAALPRQQTLAATIDWSYQLLSETQQLVFERLSVFASRWTLEAAESVCAGDGVAADEVLDALLQLFRKSLVVKIDVRHGSPRYGLLETLRQFGWHKLLDRGAELAAIRERHAAYYSALVERLDPAWSTTLLPFSGETLAAPIFDILEDAHDNVRAALRWCLDARRATDGLVLIRALGVLWHWTAIPVDGRLWLEAMLELAAAPTTTPAVPPALHAQALVFAATIARFQADYPKARAHSEASVALWKSVGDELGVAQGLASYAIDHIVRDDFQTADALLSEARALPQVGADAFTLSGVLFALGLSARAQGEPERAAALFRKTVAVAETIERASYRTFSVMRALMHLGRAESERGAPDQALALFKEVLAGMRDSGLTGNLLGLCLEWMAAERGKAGDSLRAARLFGAAEAQLRRAGAKRLHFEEASHADEVRALQVQLGQELFAHAWNEGRALESAQVFACALDEAA